MAVSFAFIPFRMDITRAGWVQGLKTCVTLNAKPLVAIYMALVAIYMALVAIYVAIYMALTTPTFRDSVFVKRPLSPQDDHVTLHYMHVYSCLCMCCGTVVWVGGGGFMQDNNHQVCGRRDV